MNGGGNGGSDGGGGGWGGGGGGAGNNYTNRGGGGGGGGGSSLVPAGAITAEVTAEAPSVSLTLPPTPAPTVTGISPATGPTAGGQRVTITGTGLAGATMVTIGGAPCTPVSVTSATTLTCVTGANTMGPASVQVTTPGGTSAANALYDYVFALPVATAPIPTLSGWAYLILAALLLALAGWYRRTGA